jgi:hypothetical protein
VTLFTGALAWLAYHQWRAMQQQAHHMRDTLAETRKAADAAIKSAEAAKRSADVLINSERAWVIVNDVSPPLFNVEGQPHEFRFEIKNIGKTVARLTGPYRTRFHLLAHNEKLPDVPEYGIAETLFPSGMTETPIYGNVLAPGETDTVTYACFELLMTPEVFESMERGDQRLYFYASLMYFDFAEKERELQFCYLYRPRTELRVAHWEHAGPKVYTKHA